MIVELNEINTKLELVSKKIQGDNFEKNTGRLNKFINHALSAWLLIDPVSGTVGKGALFASNFLDDVLSGLKDADQENINVIFNDVLDKHNEGFRELSILIDALVPKASVNYDQNKFNIVNSHGINDVIDMSDHRFILVLKEIIDNPDEYIGICNITGASTNITNDRVDIVLPDNWLPDKNIVIKVLIMRMGYGNFGF